ncbi:MAG TPA: S9 family peptidase [Spirochaetaceae bacterium]|jgi:dipeptidyl aminopeptidase/acylaminoacyl peptidase|nr:S9 family peptidase [Spirochaetaceae bacterium]
MDLQNTPLLPRKLLFDNPDKTQARLSPDGSRLSYIAPVNGVLNVWVGPADDPAAARPVTNDTMRGIRLHEWAFTSRHLLYIQDKGGDENWRIYGVNLETGQICDFTPFEKVAAKIEMLSPRHPTQVLIALNDRNPQFHDLHLLDLNTGQRQLVFENDRGFAGFSVDYDFKLRFGALMTADGGLDMFERTGNDWKPFFHVAMEDMLTTQAFGFDTAGRILYLGDSRGRDTSALVAYDTQTGSFQPLAENPQADLSDILVHPTEKRVQAVSFNHLRSSWVVLDPAIQPDVDFLAAFADGDPHIISRTNDDRFWVIAYDFDNSPVRYYRYDRRQKKMDFLFVNRKALEGQPLAKLWSVIIPARDGLELVSYYTLPLGSDTQQPGRPDRPLPMVLLVHGGPWGRDVWGFDQWHQWLANRGYAVLSVNFRSSTGFGKAFINAGNKEWGAAMHNDLLDAVDWAVQAGIADKKTVAIIGGSYGGYAGLTFSPEVFACGVDIVGPSNLITLLQTIPPYWAPMLEMFTSRVGDHRSEEGREFLKSRSPLSFVDRICKPLLIGQGANDPRVNQAESDQIVRSMQAKNIPVSYVLYPDEGHGFARPENNLSFNAVTEAFLATVLQGRFEPIGDDLKGSSITVPSGASQVPGLETALNAL